VVSVVGAGAFCVAAFNGLNSVGFHGTITTISFCITPNLPKQVPTSVLKGMKFGAEAPFGDKTDSSMRQYAAILKKYAPTPVDPNDQNGVVLFQSVAALAIGTRNLQGDVTPKSVTAALKAMPNAVLPASGGRVFRCNGKASAFSPAVCSVSTVVASLDANGNPTGYQVVNNSPIPG
jgi:branched-chain amino acid transport system substrate-binding protein